MNDWIEFTKSVPWFLKSDAVVEVSTPQKSTVLSPTVAALFPSLAKLIAAASSIDVSVNSECYELLGWDSIDGGRMGWLCRPASEKPPENLYCQHRELLSSFGGIVERFNEPETWLSNLNDALTEKEASHDGGFIRDIPWVFDDGASKLPIDPIEYYSIAGEANGNATFCHRVNGRIIMLAQDHYFRHLTVLEGCPEHSLYTINGIKTFRDWVNAVARQWLERIKYSV
jgi:hypothetical protein